MADRSGDGGFDADAIVAAFARWAADSAASEAATVRARQRWMAQQASESATFTGFLVDLAEARAVAAISVGAAHSDLVGRVVGVARDFVVIEERSGAATLVTLGAVDAVRTGPGRAPGGERAAPLGLDLAGALAALAAERVEVGLRLAGGQLVSGDLIGVGTDLAVLRATPGRDRIAVPLAAVLTCTPR